MHEVEVVGVEWVRADRNGVVRHVRLGGYEGAPTAELVITSDALIGTSWLMRPARTMRFTPDMSWIRATRWLEQAEARGADAPAWSSLNVPTLDTEGLTGLVPFNPRGHPRCLLKIANGHIMVFTEVIGAAGAQHFLVFVDGYPITRADGAALLFSDLTDTVYTAEMEVA